MTELTKEKIKSYVETTVVKTTPVAPTIDSDIISERIESIEISVVNTISGRILRWAIITLDNGYLVTGDPSICVYPENDNHELGTEIAIKNAIREVWKYLGYELNLKRHQELQEDAV